jgi:hypothetical protein
MRPRRRSGAPRSDTAASISSMLRTISASPADAVCARRATSISLRLAAANNQASGLSGAPARGHAVSAAANASESASSAAATSRVRAVSKASNRP